MSRPLPEYSLKEILQSVAVAVLYGTDALDDEHNEMLEHVTNDWYVLKEVKDE